MKDTLSALLQKPLSEIQNLILNGDISVTDIVKFTIDQNKQMNPKICSVYDIWETQSLDAAASLDSLSLTQKQRLTLLGSTFGLKSLICKKGIITTASSDILRNFVSPYDATIVDLIEKSGGIFIGNTASDEFGMGSRGISRSSSTPRNPLNLNLCTGGSSGGSAAAVAAGQVRAAIGTDTGGSVRHPSSACGVTGFKPTYGAISKHGMIPLASSLDQIGLITRTCLDNFIIFSNVNKLCPHVSDSFELPPMSIDTFHKSLPSNLKIGFLSEWNLNNDFYTEVKNITTKWADHIHAAVVMVDLKSILLIQSTYSILNSVEAMAHLNRYDGSIVGDKIEIGSYTQTAIETREKLFSERVRNRIVRGAYFAQTRSPSGDTWYELACKVRAFSIEEISNMFKSIDVLILPGATAPPPDISIFNDPLHPLYKFYNHNEVIEDGYFAIANFTGSPAIALPCMIDPKSNMPVGIQIMANKYADYELLKIAHHFEQYVSCKPYVGIDL